MRSIGGPAGQEEGPQEVGLSAWGGVGEEGPHETDCESALTTNQRAALVLSMFQSFGHICLLALIYIGGGKNGQYVVKLYTLAHRFSE